MNNLSSALKMNPNMINKFLINYKILKTLYTHEENKLNTTLDRMFENQNTLLKHSHDGFIYRGSSYRKPGITTNPSTKLHLKLHTVMDTYLLDKELLEQEKEKVRGYIIHILNLSDDAKDYYHFFPESTYEIIKETVDRQSNTMLSLSSETINRTLKQYSEITDLMRQRMLYNLIL